jgi:hypothetical protein
MARPADDSRSRYGPWAVVAGASEGLGAAFAASLARRGHDLVLMARRAEVLDGVAERLREGFGVEVRCVPIDVGAPDLSDVLARTTQGLEIGVAVYNAAYAPVGAFVETPEADLLQAVDVNARGPVVFARQLLPGMVERGRGALVLMSSLSGLQGAPRIATYAATKAFNTILAEGLWGELRDAGIDVVASCAGAIRTPGYERSATREAPGTLDAAEVAEHTLRALGHGPRTVPGRVNRLAATLMERVLPRRAAVAVMATNTRDLS